MLIECPCCSQLFPFEQAKKQGDIEKSFLHCFADKPSWLYVSTPRHGDKTADLLKAYHEGFTVHPDYPYYIAKEKNMPKQKLEIEVEVPEGYEATGEFRLPKKGDYFLNSCGDLNLSTNDWNNSNYMNSYANQRIILRKKYQWPTWLKARYIAMDKDKGWWAYDSRPILYERGWKIGEGRAFNLRHNLVDFTPPECSDWTKSLMENPNYQD
jgi:hypothetical protein